LSEARFDVIYRDGSAHIDHHFCREWDEDGGCYGTNPKHGLSFDEACDEVANWYASQAEQWRKREHSNCLEFRHVRARCFSRLPAKTSTDVVQLSKGVVQFAFRGCSVPPCSRR